MTEKRFTLLDGVKLGTRTGIWDNQKENNERIGDELWVGEVICMLNDGVAVADENKRLKKENVQLDILCKNNQLAYIDLEKENEQLKRKIDDYVDICADIREIETENEQLKSEIKKLKWERQIWR